MPTPMHAGRQHGHREGGEQHADQRQAGQDHRLAGQAEQLQRPQGDEASPP